jgi:hypothetical protein
MLNRQRATGIINYFLSIGLLLLLASCKNYNFFDFSAAQQARLIDCDSLLLMYMVGSNNLETYAMEDIDEIEVAMETCLEDDRVLILIDRIADASENWEDWDEARLFEIYLLKNEVKIEELESSSLGLSTLYVDDELNMGCGETLKLFLDFAVNHYRADHYYLDIWNHGGGWKSLRSKDIGFDDEEHDSLTLKEVREAILTSDMDHLDCVLLDACNMGSLEVAAAFIDLTDTIVFSQDVIPFDGFPYDIIVEDIMQIDDPVEVCRSICTNIFNSYKDSNPYQTISGLKIDAADALSSFLVFVNNFLPVLDKDVLRTARENKIEMPATTVDLSVFSCMDNSFYDQLTDIVIYAEPQNMSGVSIYFPKYVQYDKLSEQYHDENVHLLNLLHFDKFLQNYNHSGIENIDSFENNNSAESAHPVRINDVFESYIWCNDDVDYYTLPISAGVPLICRMQPPPNSDFDLKVYWIDDGKKEHRISDQLGDVEECIEFSSGELHPDTDIIILVCPAPGEYNQISPYILTIE